MLTSSQCNPTNPSRQRPMAPWAAQLHDTRLIIDVEHVG
jgi:hypothetical protein